MQKLAKINSRKIYPFKVENRFLFMRPIFQRLFVIAYNGNELKHH